MFRACCVVCRMVCFRYTNGVIVDPINTAAMQLALATNQTPFALLRPLNGIPVLVRVLPAGDKQVSMFVLYTRQAWTSVFPYCMRSLFLM